MGHGFEANEHDEHHSPTHAGRLTCLLVRHGNRRIDTWHGLPRR